MKQESKNTFLATAIVAGLISLPLTWMTIRNAQFEGGFGGLLNEFSLSGIALDVTGFNGYVTFLVKTPIWLIVLVAVGASALQLMRNSKSFTIPAAAEWGVAGLAVVWIGLALVTAVFSGDATPGIGVLLGFYSAAVPFAMLCVSTTQSDSTPTSEE